jgi:hypothetical protein
MRIRAALSFLFLLSAFAFVANALGDEKEHTKASGQNARLEQFKQLAGEWVGKEVADGKEGNDVHVKYKVTSNGSTVVETLFPDTDHEMITTIHQDGDDLVLKHYCALGNQPHMKASGKGDLKVVPFVFTHASNLKSEKAMHMHDVTFTFVDKDTLKTEWTHFHDGKSAGKVVFELKRKK